MKNDLKKGEFTMAGQCGIFSFSDDWEVARFLYYSLLSLQHRGAETAGIVTSDEESIYVYSKKGRVDDVFRDEEQIKTLKGWYGAGQVDLDHKSKLPFSNGEISVCFSGRVFDYDGEKIDKYDDVQLISEEITKEYKKCDAIGCLNNVTEKINGIYSIIAVTKSGDMLIARDSYGVQPLCLGSLKFNFGVVSNESATLDVIGADFTTDIERGENRIINRYTVDKYVKRENCNSAFCSFEYVYYARLDSIINGISIYECRRKIGCELAKQDDIDADVVIGVPETALPFGMGYSEETGIPAHLGFVRTGIHVRSAIKPTQTERLIGVQLKLNPIRTPVRGKKVILIDDSVVRGTTMRNIVYTLRLRGAREVHVRIGSPRIVSPCIYSDLVPVKDELIAADLTDEEITEVINADSFSYLSLEGLERSIGLSRDKLCAGCFTGEYPISWNGE